ncbi:MAG: carbohydrate kinase [Phycisphaerae bacterium]
MSTNPIPTRILGVGELLWDLLPTPPGKQLGGAVANFCYFARTLGGTAAKVTLASAVGRDILGRELLARLAQLRLNPDNIQQDDRHPTGTVTVKVDAHGQPTYTIHHPVAWDFIKCTPALLTLAGQADALCFGTLAQRSDFSRQTIRKLLQATRPDAIRVFDINLRQSFHTPEIIKESLELANVLKLNDEELPLLARALELPAPAAGDAAAETAFFKQLSQRHNLKLIALTRGNRGSTLWSYTGPAVETSTIPAETVAVVDSVGAGDAFTAALVVGLLAARPLAVIHRQASRLAAYVCTQAGATPPFTPALLDSLSRPE